MRSTLLAAATITLLAAPSFAQAPADNHSSSHPSALTADQKKGVADVRKVTAKFQDLTVAKAAGYTNQYPSGCAESPEGAQAFHFLKDSLVDDKVDLQTPELLMYEPQADGSMQLIGVDYVVPFARSATAPTLLGVPFMRNEKLGVWALHIWTLRSNPSGMFAAWNPDVNCRNAAKAKLQG
jgi:hypothetical protein